MHFYELLHTPFATKTTLSLFDGELLTDPTKYRSMVGALQYLTMIQLNIAYEVYVVSHFMYAPSSSHLFVEKQILRYLWGTLDHGIRYSVACCYYFISSCCLFSHRLHWMSSSLSIYHMVLFSLNPILLVGTQRRNLLYQNPLLKLNIVLLLILLLRRFGFASSYKTSVLS